MKSYTAKPADLGEPIPFSIKLKDKTVLKFEFTPHESSKVFVRWMQVEDDGFEGDQKKMQAMLDYLADGLNPEHSPKKGRNPRPGHREYVEECQACLLQDVMLEGQVTLTDLMEITADLMSEASGERPTT